MPQDAPADTAGPSSPPPPLPEGWLPQWEGVQRKWYYVQRATGKSQWEIPTEPVVLTPSTTPTSIGTGPSQPPPSRPATHSPQAIGHGKNVVEGNYDMPDKAGISVGSLLDSQAHGKSDSTVHEYPAVRDWLSSQTGQHPGSIHQQHSAPGHGSLGESSYGQLNNIHPPAISQGHSHLLGQPFSGQGLIAKSWTDRTGVELVHQAEVGVEQIQQPHQESLRVTLSRDSLSLYPWGATLPGTVRTGTENASRLSWHPDQRSQFPRVERHHGRIGVSQSTTSQPFLGSYPAPHDTRNSPQHFPRSFNPSIAEPDPGVQRQKSRTASGSVHSYSSPGIAAQPQSLSGYPLSRSYSEQSTGTQQLPFTCNNVTAPFLHRFPSQNPHRHSQASDMERMPSGVGDSAHVLPIGQSHQRSAGYYQNQLVQAGVNQYLPSHAQAHPANGSIHPGQGQYHHVYQDLSSQAPGISSPWVSNSEPSRAAAPDPQFVSGPWASSTPPSVANKPSRYN